MTLNKKFEYDPIKLDCGNLDVRTGPSGRQYVTPSGAKYDSITTILGSTTKGSIAEWRARVGAEEADRVSRRATTRGSTLHTHMESYLKNEEVDVKSMMPDIRCLFRQVTSVVSTRIETIYCQEVALYSDMLQAAGRLDLACRFDGVNTIVDFKTSTKPKRKDWIENYFIQAAAYAVMLEERSSRPFPQTAIIIAVDESTEQAQVFVERTKTWLPKLRNVLENYRKNKLFGHV